MNTVTSVMFVPNTPDGKLLTLLEEAEEQIADQMDWAFKLVEKPGSPLMLNFIKKFPMSIGCYRGEVCA